MSWTFPDMATYQRRRGDLKELKKDQQVRREALQELGSEIVQENPAPGYRNPNRDQARGDWDRSRSHHDEGNNRDSARDADDGLRPD